MFVCLTWEEWLECKKYLTLDSEQLCLISNNPIGGEKQHNGLPEILPAELPAHARGRSRLQYYHPRAKRGARTTG